MKVLAIIPARSGSKSVSDKNIRLFQGKPLLAHSIEQALRARTINRVIVSTDSEIYADIAREYGAEVPFLRPIELADDLSTDLDVFRHALQWLNKDEGAVPDICVHLRPTYPLRQVADIDAVARVLIDSPNFDSVRSIASTIETPFKMWLRDESGMLEPVCSYPNIFEAHSAPRQNLPKVFMQNAAIDAVRSAVILEQNSMAGQKIFGYIMKNNFDIDDFAQFAISDQLSIPEGAKEQKIFCFDIDGVIATIVPGNDYNKSGPRQQMIGYINELYARGHHIILHTARGYLSGIDWKEKTREQLCAWGVCYHELHFGKPAADYYIDDKMLPLDCIGALVNNKETV